MCKPRRRCWCRSRNRAHLALASAWYVDNVLWVYVLLLTAGIVAIVPTLVRAVDGLSSDALSGSIGFGGLASGTIGLILRFADLNGTATFITAAAFGVGAAALHPELVHRLQPKIEVPDPEPQDSRGGSRTNKPQSTRRPS